MQSQLFKKIGNYMGERRILLPVAMLLSGLSTVAGLLPYLFIGGIIRELLLGQGGANISGYAYGAVISAVAGIILYFAALSCSHLAAFRVECSIRRESMRRIVGLPLGYFDSKTTGRIRKIIDDNAGITHSFLAHQLPDLVGTVLSPIVVVVMIFVVDWRLGLVCFIPIGLAMVMISVMMSTTARDFMRAYMTSLEEMNTEAVEYVRGIPVVKVFQQTIYSFKNFHASIQRYTEMVTRYTRHWRNPMSAYTALVHSSMFFLVPTGILMMKGAASPASVLSDLMLYALVTPILAQSIMRSMYLSQAFGQTSEAIQRIDKLIDAAALPVGSPEPKPTEFSIRFENVRFTYPGADRPALDGIDLDIPQGTTLALVGTSGGGKTTLARMIPRFWDVDSGAVTIGGVDVRNIRQEDLMAMTAFVFQNTRLFKTTLLDNIRFGSPDASEREVARAVEAAQCRDIVDKLPDGLATQIGSEGTYLSGGEQQRIALARAVLKDAPIILLDEATAFADPENEHLIQRAFKHLTAGKTVLMIAHRLSSVVHADRIAVVHEGRIAELGNHAELLALGGRYASMWKEYQQSVNWKIDREAAHA